MPKLARAISWCDLSFTWFAGEHAFPAIILSKAFGKRSIIVAGGYDVAYVPELNYGQFTLRWDKMLYTKTALNNADAVLGVSNFTKEEVLKRSKPRNVAVICNGIDTAKFRPSGKKENLVITVAYKGSKSIIRLKGIDTFIRAAANLPEARFGVIGLREEDLSLDFDIPKNLELTGHIDQKQIIDHYQRAKVYCQLSYIESFGVALAEAMACECVPVVTDRGALPEVVGETGFYVPFADVNRTVKAIGHALTSKKGASAAKRIRESFSAEIRERELVDRIKVLTKMHNG
jgi:glycosyltransferase involved in cell wall biosynthesis